MIYAPDIPVTLTCRGRPVAGELPSAPALPAEAVPRRLVLQWHITERCNLRCAHCYQEGDAAGELPPESWPVVLDQFRSLLVELHRARGGSVAGQVTVTGGEPFIHGQFPRLLEMLAEGRADWSFAILTNGTLIDRACAKALGRLRPRYVQVSIEGSRDTHDQIRGRGNYDRAVAGLRNLVAEGICAVISFTAHRGNYREFGDVARLGRCLGVQRVWADRLVPLGSGAALEDQLLDPRQTRELFQLMQREQRHSWLHRTRVTLHRALQFLVGGGQPYRCTAGESLLTLLPDGTLCPCRRLPIPVGNILRTSMADLYTRSPVLVALREHRVGKGCERCFYARVCRGGLRCLASAVHGDPFRADPGCWLARGMQSSSSPAGAAVGGISASELLAVSQT